MDGLDDSKSSADLSYFDDPQFRQAHGTRREIRLAALRPYLDPNRSTAPSPRSFGEPPLQCQALLYLSFLRPPISIPRVNFVEVTWAFGPLNPCRGLLISTRTCSVPRTR